MLLLKRSTPNSFKVIATKEGELTSEQGKIEEKIVSFYKDLYETFDRRTIASENDANFFNNLDGISGDEDANLGREITVEDLAKTLTTCKDSAPEPDGIPYSIY